MNEPRPGATLDHGRYRIVRVLGAGTMGTVYEAENTATGRRVAVKCVQLGRMRDDTASSRLLNEARTAARIRHPNVVDVYDVVRDQEALYLVMEFLEGETLSARLKRARPSVAEALELLLPVLRGVAAAHRRAVIHRDIKPDNIFLANVDGLPAPVPKLLDFGISKLRPDDPEHVALTGSDQVIGTPLYMSLEQFMNKQDIDARTDVYALGVVLYEALTGDTPFQAATLPHLIVQLTTTSPPPPRTLRPEISEALETTMLTALARERTQRTPTVDALIGELERELQALRGAPPVRIESELPRAPAAPITAGSTARTTAAPRELASSQSARPASGALSPRVLGVLGVLAVVAGLVGLSVATMTRSETNTAATQVRVPAPIPTLPPRRDPAPAGGSATTKADEPPVAPAPRQPSDTAPLSEVDAGRGNRPSVLHHSPSAPSLPPSAARPRKAPEAAIPAIASTPEAPPPSAPTPKPEALPDERHDVGTPRIRIPDRSEF